MAVLHFDQKQFEEMIKTSDKLVVVDFWAPWCGPCTMLGPILESIEAELNGKAIIGKINVDQNRELAIKYRVSSIPALLMFKNGELVQTMIGLSTAEHITSEINRNL